MFNDCWPAANGWSIIDYYAMPKPAYYVFKRCAQPVLCCLTENDNKFEVRISNDTLKDANGKCKLYLYDFKKDSVLIEYNIKFTIEKNSSDTVYALDY